MIISEIDNIISQVRVHLGDELSSVADCFEACFKSNLSILNKPEADGSVFLVTGDIPAMWLRDSSCQMRPYLFFAKNIPEIAKFIEGIIKKQMIFINLDPYANAFMKNPDDISIWKKDITDMKPGVWERKYEIDSLCFPIKLAYDYWKYTGNTAIFDKSFRQASERILSVFKTEQFHEEKSTYHFQRKNCPYIDSLSRDGKGSLVRSGCGLIWSAFRPSDDGCSYGYLIPSNMFAVVTLEHLAEISSDIWNDTNYSNILTEMAICVRKAIEKEAIVPVGSDRFDKTYYAYEVDGWGQYLIMDDANFPNLLSAPYLGYCKADSPLYQETKKRILSEENPYYYHGSYAKGLGSIHTKNNYIWPLSIGMQGLVSDDREEKRSILLQMASLDAGTHLMHESINVENPSDYTRPLFGWANAIFSELVLDYCGFIS